MSEEEIIEELVNELKQADYLKTTYVAYDKEYIRKILELYQAEKEKNKDIKAIVRNDNPPPIIHFASSGLEYELIYIEKGKTAKDFISKDKIREKIEELEKEYEKIIKTKPLNDPYSLDDYDYSKYSTEGNIYLLKELLEERS